MNFFELSSWKMSQWIPSGPPHKVLLLGLQGVGKTTLLYRAKGVSNFTTAPTLGFNVEGVSCGSTNFEIWDVGGHPSVRRFWGHPTIAQVIHD